MAARTTVKSGLASDSTVFNGGTPLAEDDTLTIVAGHTLTWDLDWSAASVGMGNILISGIASGTPAQLTCPTTAGNYVLKLKASASIYGSNSTVKGQFYIGTSPEEPLPYDARFTIMCLQSALVNATYLDVKCYCSRPTITEVRLTQNAAIGATVLNVDTDVTGDRWKVGDYVSVVRHLPASGSANSEMRQIVDISSTTITIDVALGVAKPQYSWVVLASRNVNIYHYFTANAYCFQGMVYGYWDGAITGTLNVANSSVRGYAGAHSYSTIKGVIAGCYYGTISCAGCTIDLACTHSYLAHNGNTISKIEPTCKTIGCVYGFYNEGVETAGLVAACTYGVYGMGWVVGSTTQILGNYRGLYRGDHTILQGAILGGSDAITQNGGGDVAQAQVGITRSYGNVLRSSIQAVSMATSINYVFNEYTAVLCYDVADTNGTPQLGRIAGWTQGGYVKSMEWADVPGAIQTGCPVLPQYLHQFNNQSSTQKNWFEWVISSSKTINLVVYMKLDRTGMTQRPKIQLADPSYQIFNPSGVLAETQAADTLDWQMLSLSYTPAGHKDVRLRIFGIHSIGVTYCYWEQPSSTRDVFSNGVLWG